MRTSNRPAGRRPRASRSARFASIGVVTVFGLAGCGKVAEKATEELVEQAIERESGENVQVDIGDDGVSIEGDQGSFEVDEEGNFVATDEEGNTITGGTDEDGNVVVESDEGTFTGTAGGLPDNWPDDIPVPAGVTIEGASVIETAEGMLMTLGGTADDAAAVATAYAEQLESVGFERTMSNTFDGAVTYQLRRDHLAAMITGAEGQFSLFIGSETG